MKDYADYADFCFKMFGDMVENRMTFNKPREVLQGVWKLYCWELWNRDLYCGTSFDFV